MEDVPVSPRVLRADPAPTFPIPSPSPRGEPGCHLIEVHNNGRSTQKPDTLLCGPASPVLSPINSRGIFLFERKSMGPLSPPLRLRALLFPPSRNNGLR